MMSEFLIKVKGLDNTQIELIVNSSLKISELKQIIYTHTQIPEDRQRLLFNTRLLLPEKTLHDYSIVSESTVQIIANLERRSEEELNDLVHSALESLPSNYISSRRSRDPQRELDLNEKLEAVYQNIETIDLILNKSKNWVKGLWVDVKDTVDQWLEAQIIDSVSTSYGTNVFVHYNGWPSRWDEWIPTGSSRISYFRTQTFQSLVSPMYSPYPSSRIDSDFKRFPQIELQDCLIRSVALIERTKVLIEEKNWDSLGSVFDRLGKVLCDIAGIIGNTRDESYTNSVLTSESNSSWIRPAMQVPVMPTSAELALMAPRGGSDLDIHIHAFFGIRGLEEALNEF